MHSIELRCIALHSIGLDFLALVCMESILQASLWSSSRSRNGSEAWFFRGVDVGGRQAGRLAIGLGPTAFASQIWAFVGFLVPFHCMTSS